MNRFQMFLISNDVIPVTDVIIIWGTAPLPNHCDSFPSNVMQTMR